MSSVILKDRQICGSKTNCLTGHQDRHTRHLQTHPVKSHQEQREKGQLVGEVSFIQAVSDITQYRQRKRLTVQERQDMRQ